MRFIALDVHRDFCQVAIKDESGLRLAGRIKSSPAELELFALSLAPGDQVALEATGPALSDRADSRSPCRTGVDRQHAQAACDRRVQDQDRQARRCDLVRAAGGRVPAHRVLAR
jgi:hypothetical protein